MKLSEISKDEFHRKLADPEAQELHDIVQDVSNALYPMSFRVYGEDTEKATIECVAPWDDEEMDTSHLEGVNIITSVQRRIVAAENWSWVGWTGDADDVSYCHATRKT